MHPHSAVCAPDEVSMILLHLEVVDRDRTFALLLHNLRDCERRPGASDDRVAERESSGDDEPDALHIERMLAGGGEGLGYFTGVGV